MDSLGYITSRGLFERAPDQYLSPGKINELDFVKSASIPLLIDLTYVVITAAVFNVPETLRVWELRLTLLLFSGQLAIAKREAINLNRLIYLHENPDQLKNPLIQTPVPGSASGQGPNVSQHLYPLPRNNENSVPYLLLLLLLRLKSTPSMGMVNECYRLCYQLRLRGKLLESDVLQKRLMQLAYLIVVQLVITKNNLTLLSYLESLSQSLQLQLKVRPTSKVLEYSDRINFAFFLAQGLAILRHTKESVVQDAQFEALRPNFESSTPQVLELLMFALNSWAPHVNGPSPEEKLAMSDLTFENVVFMMRTGRISVRIVCCTLAVWDLDSAFDVTLEDNKLVLKVSSNGEQLDNTYEYIMSQWGQHVNRVFCVE